jgi:hypothetical protein
MAMGLRHGCVALLLLALVSCVPGVQRALPTDRNAHDRAVEELERRAAAEQGWLVLPLPNLHEGGGTTTWWLHPCEPGARDRVVTRTAFHGSDVAGLPGRHDVEQGRLPCEEPSPDLDLADRTVHLDVEVVDLGLRAPRAVALIADREEVEIVDADHGTVHRVELRAGAPTHGPCDGRTRWSARLESQRELMLDATGCVGVLAALPDDAVSLLDPGSASSVHDATAARIADADAEAFVAALSTSGFEPEEIRSLTFEELTTETIWLGPCGPSLDRDGNTRTMVDVHGGVATVSERAC